MNPTIVGKQGSALLLVVLVSAIFMVLAVILVKMVYNSQATVSSLLQREQAFWLAEAGLEKGKVELNHNPGWYTDLPHYPEGDVDWLKAGAVGQKTNLGNGWVKVVREKDRDRLYSIGSKGKGIVVLKLSFSNPPFKSLKWEEL